MSSTNTNKWYYEFSVTDKTGAQTKKYAILKPNRKIREDGELFFASETSRFAKAGVLPRAAWNTILSNGGGTISDSERESYGKLLADYRTNSFELQSILIKSDGSRSEDENKRIEELLVKIEEIKRNIQSFESEQINIFENTAEAKARNRTILWWMLQLSFVENSGSYVPVFDGESFYDKLDKYDEINDSDNEELSFTVQRLTYLVTLWFLGRAEKTEDFASLDQEFSSSKKEENAEVKPEEDAVVAPDATVAPATPETSAQA